MQSKLEIGQRIRRLREAHGYTREQLAEFLDISPRFCYDIELGKKGMSLETLCAFSQALNVSTDYILFGPKQESANTAEETDMETFEALIESCPDDKRGHLETIITSYLKALRT
ncbi:MAG: helix-turn-helix domain-containing protein [Lachnospiraceae bacterium]|nr:helix-turn-helix domain-containing protein [Lachnospiraceae bacterium]